MGSIRQTCASTSREVIFCSWPWVETSGVATQFCTSPVWGGYGCTGADPVQGHSYDWRTVESVTGREAKRAGAVHPGEEKVWKDLNHVWVSKEEERARLSPALPLRGQGTMTTHWKTGNPIWKPENNILFFLWGWPDAGTNGGGPIFTDTQNLAELSPGKPVLADLALSVRVGLHDTKGSLSTSAILWFCEVWLANPFYCWCYTHFLCHYCTPAHKWKLLSYKNYLHLGLPTFGSFSATENNKKTAMEKAHSVVILRPSLLRVLLPRLTFIPKLIPQCHRRSHCYPTTKGRLRSQMQSMGMPSWKIKSAQKVLNILKGGNV